MTFTGKDVHKAFYRAFPYLSGPWEMLAPVSQQGYEQVACELSKLLEDDDVVTIRAARCPNCKEMLQSEHAEGHACWLEVK